MTRFYGVDCFPPWASGAYRRYWLKAAEMPLRARDRLLAGSVTLDTVFDVAMEAYGCEEKASAIKSSMMAALNRQPNQNVVG